MKKEKVFFECFRYNTVKDAILSSVEKNKEKVAFVLKVVNKELKERYKNEGNFDKEKYLHITYDELNRDALCLAQYFIKKGYKKISVISKNRYEWVVIYLACIYAGIILVPLDKNLTNVEVLNSLNLAEVDMLIYEKELENTIDENIRNLEIEFMYMNFEEDNNIYNLIDEGKVILEKSDYKGKKIEDVIVKPEDTLLILFTSGTTSKSKGVVLTQENIASNLVDVVLVEDIKEKDNTLAFLPYHHAFRINRTACYDIYWNNNKLL